MVGVLLLCASWLPSLAGEPQIRDDQAIVAAWHDIGAAQGIPGDRLIEVGEILLDALSLVKKQPDEEFTRRFRESLPAFLTVHQGYLKDPLKSKAVGRWLAYCTAEALTRKPIVPAERKRLVAEYRTFYKGYARYLEQRVRQQLPGEAAGDLGQRISQSFAKWVDDATKRTSELQDDLLFPCLRQPVPKEMRKILEEKYSEVRHPPVWRERMGISRQEWLGSHVDCLVRKSVAGTLFYLTIHEVRPKLRVNRYWGYTLCGAGGGGHSLWPICMQLRVCEARNVERGWKRRDEE